MRLRCWRGLDDKCSTLKSTGSTSETLGKTRLQPTFTLLFLIDNKLLSQVYVFFKLLTRKKYLKIESKYICMDY